MDNVDESGESAVRESDWKDLAWSWRYSLARELIDFHLFAEANVYDNDLIGFDRVNNPNPIPISVQLVIAREVHANLVTQVFTDLRVFFKLGKLFGYEKFLSPVQLPEITLRLTDELNFPGRHGSGLR